MIIELFIILEIVMIGLFIASFFTKQELLWVIVIILSALLMISSYSVQLREYVYNSSTGAYEVQLVTHSYPYLMGVNMVFFGLSVILFFFDVFDKYGGFKIAKRK